MISLGDILSEVAQYTSMFNKGTKFRKTFRVYITFKILFSRSILDLKHNDNVHVEIVFDTLIKNNVFLGHNKF